METIIAQLVGGVLGGASGGKLMPSADMGKVGNLIAGAAGGLGGGQLLGGLLGGGAAAAGGVDIASMASSLVGGGVAGMVVQVVAGIVIKKLRG